MNKERVLVTIDQRSRPAQGANAKHVNAELRRKVIGRFDGVELLVGCVAEHRRGEVEVG